MLDVPGPVDLAVVAVPAAAVIEVVGQCAAKGVAGVVVLSAGFGEVGAQAAVRDLVRRNGMRLVGPNGLGVVNTAIGLDATFSPYAPGAGRIAMQSKSGALGIAILERSARIGLGVSSFVSVGNKADVSGNDLLQYWEGDPGTDVVLLYLEPSATLASSPASPGGCRAANPSSPSRAADQPPARGPPRRTPRRWPARTSPSTPCSVRPA